MDDHQFMHLVMRFAVVLTILAVAIGAVAIFTSGYTAGNYVHDLAILVIALAVLSVGGHKIAVRVNGDRPPEPERAPSPSD